MLSEALKIRNNKTKKDPSLFSDSFVFTNPYRFALMFLIIKFRNVENKMTVSERFLKYVSFGTNSDESSDTCPSTESQLELGRYPAEELKSIGLCDI